MAEIRSLNGAPAPEALVGTPNPELIAEIEQLLSDVRSGHAQFVAFIAMDAQNRSQKSCIGHCNVPTIIGELEVLKQRLVHEVL